MADYLDILLRLAEERDKFEHERSSSVDMKTGLLLVVTGLLASLGWDLFEATRQLAHTKHFPLFDILTKTSLGGIGLAVILLLAALIGTYRTPARPSRWLEYIERLRLYHAEMGSTVELEQDLKREVLEALSRSVDQNAESNNRKLSLIKGALVLLVISTVATVSLFSLLAHTRGSMQP